MLDDFEELDKRLDLDLNESWGAASEETEALVYDLCKYIEGRKLSEKFLEKLENYRINLTANGECEESQRLHDILSPSLSKAEKYNGVKRFQIWIYMYPDAEAREESTGFEYIERFKSLQQAEDWAELKCKKYLEGGTNDWRVHSVKELDK